MLEDKAFGGRLEFALASSAVVASERKLERYELHVIG
jgi:hypothetical protein